MAKIQLRDLGKALKKQNVKVKNLFTDENIQKIFGHEAADDEDLDRLKEYYVKNILYEKITSDLKLRVLVGHKGIGKSAMFKIAEYEDGLNKRLSVSIRPDDISDLTKDSEDFLKTIRIWKDGLNEIILTKLLQNLGAETKSDSTLKEKIKNWGGELIDIIQQTISSDKIKLDPAKEKVRNACLKNRKINVYIDDLDRGWKGRKKDILRGMTNSLHESNSVLSLRYGK